MSDPSLQRQYWRFYWPLSVTGLAMLLARQFQNGALARYPDAVHELATFAFASSMFWLFNATLIFVPQMANILARSRRGRRVCFRFTLGVSLLLTGGLTAIALTRSGSDLLRLMYDIEGKTLADVMRYLRYFLLLPLVNGLRHYYVGLLVQARRTGWVTLMNMFYLAIVIATLLFGFQAGWGAVKTLALAQVGSGVVHLLISFVLNKILYHSPEVPEHEDLTYGQALRFFWPVATTSTMFALSRPILYSFVSRMPNSDPIIAALRVAFDFAMIFHAPMNQFRNLFVTFGRADLAGIRRFMVRMMLSVTVLMAIVAVTPIGAMIFSKLLSIEDSLLAMANSVVILLCGLPLLVSIRNYFHGLSMIDRRTGPMAVGAICRNVSIYALSAGLYAWGWLDHVAATVVLLMGFVTETTVVVLFYLRQRNDNE